MERKTTVTAEDGKQELRISREFDLPVELLFRAHAEPEIVERWMGTTVLKLEGQKHGSWQFETKDPQGKVVFRANGCFHDFVQDKKIVRTFEMENTPFGVQLEFLSFEKISEDRSRLDVHIIYESVSNRDQMLKIGMGAGMNMAHNRLQDLVGKLKNPVI